MLGWGATYPGGSWLTCVRRDLVAVPAAGAAELAPDPWRLPVGVAVAGWRAGAEDLVGGLGVEHLLRPAFKHLVEPGVELAQVGAASSSRGRLRRTLRSTGGLVD